MVLRAARTARTLTGLSSDGRPEKLLPSPSTPPSATCLGPLGHPCAKQTLKQNPGPGRARIKVWCGLRPDETRLREGLSSFPRQASSSAHCSPFILRGCPRSSRDPLDTASAYLLANSRASCSLCSSRGSVLW